MEEILARARAGRLSMARAAGRVRADSIERVGIHLKLDLGRARRTGIPEVVLAEGKRPADVRRAALAFVRAHGRAIVTRAGPWLRFGRTPGVEVTRHVEARVAVLRRRGARAPRTGGRVALLTAGTSDRGVAAEVEVVARELGCVVRVERDVGVAALIRLLDALARLEPWAPHVYVAVAGREGALPTVTAGLVPAPVVGVPASSGYGRGGRGEAALNAMLQSCAPLAVVNIDAGFVAGALAAQIANHVAAAERRARRTR